MDRMNRIKMPLIGCLLNKILMIWLIPSEKYQEVKDMNRMNNKRTDNLKMVVVVLVVITICFTMVPGFKSEVRAGDGAAFLGGMVAGHIVGGAIRRSRIRTAAAVEMASQPRTVQQAAPAPAPAAPQTQEQKLQQLDKLAAGGYITPAEYKAKKKAILDGM